MEGDRREAQFSFFADYRRNGCGGPEFHFISRPAFEASPNTLSLHGGGEDSAAGLQMVELADAQPPP
jgi:hypothetical protein